MAPKCINWNYVPFLSEILMHDKREKEREKRDKNEIEIEKIGAYLTMNTLCLAQAA